MSNIDKQALREAAEKATKGPWKVFSDIDTKTFAIHTPRDKRCENVIKWGGFDCQPNAEANAEFIAVFNPKVALALLDEVEAAEHTAAVDHEAACSLVEENEELKRRITEMESKNSNLRTIAHEQNELAIRANLDSINDAVEMDSLHKRIAELEAREVTLPAEKFCPSEYAGSQYWEETEVWNKAISACAVAVRAVGIKVKGERDG
ncbi:ead/Ea22-like family protein [Salmonella enterica]|nr:ead/Ea22-like family protein [Salmonella enterica]